MVDVGDLNENDQQVIENTGLASTTHYNQTIYVLRCLRCFEVYGANGCDCHIRRCPTCQGGQPGEPVPLRKFSPSPDDNFENGDFVYHETFGLGRVVGFTQNKVSVEFLDHEKRFILPAHLSFDDADSYRAKLLDDAGYDRTEVEYALSEVQILHTLRTGDHLRIDVLEVQAAEQSAQIATIQEENATLREKNDRLQHELSPLRQVLERKGIRAWFARKIISRPWT